MKKTLNDASRIPELAKAKGVSIEVGKLDTDDELIRIIDGVTYDTEKSEIIDSWILCDDRMPKGESIVHGECLFQTKNGEFFLLIDSSVLPGMPHPAYALIPLTDEDASEWTDDSIDRFLMEDELEPKGLGQAH
jgi:hypothetical protein